MATVQIATCHPRLEAHSAACLHCHKHKHQWRHRNAFQFHCKVHCLPDRNSIKHNSKRNQATNKHALTKHQLTNRQPIRRQLINHQPSSHKRIKHQRFSPHSNHKDWLPTPLAMVLTHLDRPHRRKRSHNTKIIKSRSSPSTFSFTLHQKIQRKMPAQDSFKSVCIPLRYWHSFRFLCVLWTLRLSLLFFLYFSYLI